MNCPKCGFVQPDGMPDCQRCQVIFSKWQARQTQAAETMALPEAMPAALPRPAAAQPATQPPPANAAPPAPPPNDYLPQYTYIPPVRNMEPEAPKRNWGVGIGLLIAIVLLGWGLFAALQPGTGLPVPEGAYRDQANGFALVPPEKWVSINPDNFTELLRQYGAAIPQNIRDLVQNGKYAAYFMDVSSKRSAGDSLNIVVHNQQMPRLSDSDRKELEKLFTEQARAVLQNFKVNRSELTQIDKLQAMRLDSEGTMNLPALRQSINLKMSQVYVPGDGRTYIITCGAESAEVDCDQIFNSFRVLKRPSLLGGKGIFNGALKGGLIGAAIGLGVGFIKWLIGGS
jgi:hypothetical protein